MCLILCVGMGLHGTLKHPVGYVDKVLITPLSIRKC